MGDLSFRGDECLFYLGSHMVNFMVKTDKPLFISARRLRRLKSTPAAAACRWSLDSGGFSEIQQYGKWMTTPEQYAREAVRWSRQAGGMDWAAVQDWMCEPVMLAKTGLTVMEHQRRTIKSYLSLSTLAPSVRWVPVLQGWRKEDYHRHLKMYANRGIDLRAMHTVGLGSVCRRQASDEITDLIKSLHGEGLHNLHGFGVKADGLAKAGHLLKSADSMAWSFVARRRKLKLPDCFHKAMNCANCLRWALRWRKEVLSKVWISKNNEIHDCQE